MRNWKFTSSTTYLCKLIRNIKSIFFISPTELLISFNRNKTLYLNTERYLGWKKDFYDFEVLKYERDSGTAFLILEDKFFCVSRFANKKFEFVHKYKCRNFSKLIRQEVHYHLKEQE